SQDVVASCVAYLDMTIVGLRKLKGFPLWPMKGEVHHVDEDPIFNVQGSLVRPAWVRGLKWF
ncbi:unnamed protein product, partial [marine sediment metagenome]